MSRRANPDSCPLPSAPLYARLNDLSSEATFGPSDILLRLHVSDDDDPITDALSRPSRVAI